MNLVEQITKLSQELPPDKQTEALDFVAFLMHRQVRTTWTVEGRLTVVANTMGCLAHTSTTSDAFAARKATEKVKCVVRYRSASLSFIEKSLCANF